MTEFDSAALERAVTADSTDLEARDARALTEYMTTLPLGGDVYSVTTQSGSEYHVDAREGRCTCPDARHRGVSCKHQHRVAFATGQRAVPAWVDPDAVDPQLGEHVDGTPVLADGGVDVARTATDASDGRARPEECTCDEFECEGQLPCFDCWMAGFDVRVE